MATAAYSAVRKRTARLSHGSDQVTTRSRLKTILGGLVMTAVGIAGYALTAETNTLTCHRSTNQCVHERQGFRSTRVTRFPLDSVIGAEIRAPRQSSKPSAARMIVLLTRTGPVEFMGYATEVRKKAMAEQAAAINTFLSATTPDALTARRDDRLVGVLIGAVPILIGLGLIVFAFVARGEAASSKPADPR
jgi:hypothetical protein